MWGNLKTVAKTSGLKREEMVLGVSGTEKGVLR